MFGASAILWETVTAFVI